VLAVDYEKFFPHISAGIITWNLIATTLTNAPSVFILNASNLKSFRIPSSVYVGQNVMRWLIVFGHAIVIHALVIVMFHVPVNESTALAPLGLLLLVAILYPATALLAMLGARFRDIGPAIGSLFYLMFLVTPVLWSADLLTTRQYIVDYNPLAHMLEIVRSPLIGKAPSTLNWGVCGAFALISWALALGVAMMVKRKTVFWV
jgi:lipopolysaccharide transport system permease protein